MPSKSFLIASALEQKIRDEKLKAGDALPSLSEVDGVSYYTIPLSQMNQSPDMGVRFPDDGILNSVRYRLYVYDADGNLAGTQDLAGFTPASN